MVQQSRRHRAKSSLISVIIPTFTRAESLEATLESFAAQSMPKDRYEVIVVDDGSKDATPEVCRDHASRIQLRYFYIDNSGIAAAKNTGILASRGRILLFFDDDDIADPRLLEEHLKAHKRHPAENTAVLGYSTWAPTLSVTPLMHYVTEIGRFLFAYGDLKDGQMLDFTYFWGGRSSCKRSFLAKYGVFNRQFRTIIEDMELGYRLSKFGFRVVFHRPAVSYMVRPLSLDDFCDRCERQGEALFLFSRLPEDAVGQQYCQSADPFIENRAVAVDPEARWPDVASLFREKIEEVGRVERLLAWGFEPKTSLERSSQAEAYRLQMRELFSRVSQAEAYHLQMRELFAKVSEVERLLSERAAVHQAELAKLNEDMGDLAKTKDDLRDRLTKANSRHQIEVQQLRDRVTEANSQHQIEVQQFRDRVTENNRLLHNRSISLAEQEQRITELTDRLRKQLWDTRRLSHLLDDAKNAAARLRSSRRWKLANPATSIQAKLFPGKVSMGYGHLEKIVTAYSQWRASHPEIAKIEDEIKKLQFPTIPRAAAVELATSRENVNDFEPVSEDAIPQLAPANKAPALSPPIPSVPVESIHFPTHEKVDVSDLIPVCTKLHFPRS